MSATDLYNLWRLAESVATLLFFIALAGVLVWVQRKEKK